MTAALPPILQRVEPTLRDSYNLFFNQTDEEGIKNFGYGKSLTDLVELAESVVHVISRANPIWDTWEGQETNAATVIQARQWQLDRISEVKQRVANAMVEKQKFYEDHVVGKIVKFILKCFCLWNNGNTAAITKAEDFLLFWDSRVPVFKENGKYTMRYFWPMVPVRWIQENLNTNNFYNCTPCRQIQVKGTSYGLQPINGRLPALPPGFVGVN